MKPKNIGWPLQNDFNMLENINNLESQQEQG